MFELDLFISISLPSSSLLSVQEAQCGHFNRLFCVVVAFGGEVHPMGVLEGDMKAGGD
jgi:hypothetical protein